MSLGHLWLRRDDETTFEVAVDGLAADMGRHYALLRDGNGVVLQPYHDMPPAESIATLKSFITLRLENLSKSRDDRVTVIRKPISSKSSQPQIKKLRSPGEDVTLGQGDKIQIGTTTFGIILSQQPEVQVNSSAPLGDDLPQTLDPRDTQLPPAPLPEDFSFVKDSFQLPSRREGTPETQAEGPVVVNETPALGTRYADMLDDQVQSSSLGKYGPPSQDLAIERRGEVNEQLAQLNELEVVLEDPQPTEILEEGDSLPDPMKLLRQPPSHHKSFDQQGAVSPIKQGRVNSQEQQDVVLDEEFAPVLNKENRDPSTEVELTPRISARKRRIVPSTASTAPSAQPSGTVVPQFASPPKPLGTPRALETSTSGLSEPRDIILEDILRADGNDDQHILNFYAEVNSRSASPHPSAQFTAINKSPVATPDTSRGSQKRDADEAGLTPEPPSPIKLPDPPKQDQPDHEPVPRKKQKQYGSAAKSRGRRNLKSSPAAITPAIEDQDGLELASPTTSKPVEPNEQDHDPDDEDAGQPVRKPSKITKAQAKTSRTQKAKSEEAKDSLSDEIILSEPQVVIGNTESHEQVDDDHHSTDSEKRRSNMCRASRTSSTRASPGLSHPRILFSNSSLPEKGPAITAFLRNIGGQIVTSAKNDFDVLCVGPGEIRKTTKLLSALARQKPVVHDTWLADSAKKRAVQDLAAYLASDGPRERQWGIKLATTCQDDRSQLFAGKKLFISPALRKHFAQFDEIEGIIAAVGGELVKATASKVAHFDPNDVVVLCADSKDPAARILEKAGLAVYSKDLLTMSVIRGRADLTSNDFRLGPG